MNGGGGIPFGEYLLALSPRFGLRHWYVLDGGAAGDRPGGYGFEFGRSSWGSAEVRVSGWDRCAPPEAQMRAAAYALVRCHAEDGRRLAGERGRVWTEGDERGAEALAGALAPLLPPPGEILDTMGYP